MTWKSRLHGSTATSPTARPAEAARNLAGPSGSAAPGNGGAVHVSGTNGTLVDIVNSMVRGNRAASEGGGLSNESGSTMNVTNTIIQNNFAFGTAADNGGGGLFNNGGDLNVFSSAIIGNSATTPTTTSAGRVFTAADSMTTLANGSSVFANTPDDFAGPGTVA